MSLTRALGEESSAVKRQAHLFVGNGKMTAEEVEVKVSRVDSKDKSK
jgi:hypothetical protein